MENNWSQGFRVSSRVVFGCVLASGIALISGCTHQSPAVVVAVEPSHEPSPQQPTSPATGAPTADQPVVGQAAAGQAPNRHGPDSERSDGNGHAVSPETPGAGRDNLTSGDADPAQPNPAQPDAAQPDAAQPDAAQPDAAQPDPGNGPLHPFPHRVAVPDFPQDMEWLNVARPLRKQDLKGKFVLLDFWTYCCINCMHILPELKKLEREFPDQLIVIGVHSAKFETEKGTKNIEDAILRYEIVHPVVNDADHRIWDNYGVRSWPSVILIDPEGQAVWGRPGEFKFEEVSQILRTALPYYRQQQTLDETPIRFELAVERQLPTALRFPGKILADESGGRLFVADSNHNRLVVVGLDGKLQAVIGNGTIGRDDGNFASATFHHPQGMALHGSNLYVADTENHLLRKVDLETQRVSTIAGTGEQGKGWPGIEQLQPGDVPPLRWIGKPTATAINSPWDLWIHADQLYVAMAGPHQIWKMALDESEIGPYAGNGREDVVDGPLLPRVPYQEGFASFAQPSGLSSDGEFLFVADSEGSSIRAVPFDSSQKVRTIVGTADLPYNRLFSFGDKDGPRGEVLLQHCLAVTYQDGQLYVADTYNNKIKVVDAKTGSTRTLAGTGTADSDEAPGSFDEPAGIAWCRGRLYVADTNNHRIRTVDPQTGQVETLAIAGLQPPAPPTGPRRPDLSRAPQIAVDRATTSAPDGQVTVNVVLQLPTGWKINDRAPMRYWIEAVGEPGPLARSEAAERKVDPPTAEFTAVLPVRGTGNDALRVSLVYYYCQEGGEGLCKVGSVVWNAPLTIDTTGSANAIRLKYQVAE